MLEPEKCPHIVALYNFDLPSQADQFRKFLQSISVILRVLSSWRKQIKIDEFEVFVKKTHLQLHDIFPWMQDNETVHGYLGHIAQDIRKNNCYGFGQKGKLS